MSSSANGRASAQDAHTDTQDDVQPTDPRVLEYRDARVRDAEAAVRKIERQLKGIRETLTAAKADLRAARAEKDGA